MGTFDVELRVFCTEIHPKPMRQEMGCGGLSEKDPHKPIYLTVAG